MMGGGYVQVCKTGKKKQTRQTRKSPARSHHKSS